MIERFAPLSIHLVALNNRYPPTRPKMIETTKNTITNIRPVSSPSISSDHPQLTLSVPATATPAPTNPPTRDWVVEHGIPKYQVTMFQAMAPANAEMVMIITNSGSSTSISPVMVKATADPPNSVPSAPNDATNMSPCLGVAALLATSVAAVVAPS